MGRTFLLAVLTLVVTAFVSMAIPLLLSLSLQFVVSIGRSVLLVVVFLCL